MVIVKINYYLHFHWISINLTHVLTPILSCDASDMQCPSVDVVVGDGKSRIIRNHVFMNGQNRFRISLDPSYLIQSIRR